LKQYIQDNIFNALTFIVGGKPKEEKRKEKHPIGATPYIKAADFRPATYLAPAA